MTDEGLKRLRRIKAVDKLWCRVARHVITDCEWFDSKFGEVPLSQFSELLDNAEGLRLPLQFTLHPKSDNSNFFGYGPSKGQLKENPGNPLFSVFGTLRDLVLVRKNPECRLAEASYEIARMVLEVDGVEEPFDTAWGAMATKFKLDRACMYESTLGGSKVMRKELEMICIGFNLQNKFWQPLADLDEVIFELHEKLYRCDGSPCVVTDRE